MLKRYIKSSYLNWIVSIIVTGIFLFGGINYISQNRDYIVLLEGISFVDIILIGFLHVLILIIYSYYQQVILYPFSIFLSFFESSRVTVLANLGNTLVPMRFGAVLRGGYLMKNHKLPLSKFVSTFGGITLVVLFVNFSIGSLGMVYLAINGTVSNIFLPLFFVFCSISLFYLVFFSIPKKLTQLKILELPILRTVNRIVLGWEQIKKYGSTAIKLSLAMLASSMITTIIFFMEASALGFQVTIFNAMIYTCIYNVSMILTFTPGSIGIRESLMILLSGSLGLSTGDILLVSVVDRIIQIIAIAFWGAITEVKLRIFRND